jgi:tetrahydromethanopterin S-methyltransferase subunit A
MKPRLKILVRKTGDELRQAMGAKKCWRCGCFQDTVNSLQGSAAIYDALGPLLDEAHALFEPKCYDCLGCEICWPAVAQNLAAEIAPVVAEGGHCATEESEIRPGWPPLPGDYQTIRFQAQVAVCTLNSDFLIRKLVAMDIDGLSIIGSLHTENLGIEYLIRNVLANPHIRFLIVCGEDTQKAIGHLPGQSLISLVRHGVDENMRMRIVEAKGKRPLLKNLDISQINAFRQQVQVLEHIGLTDVQVLRNLIMDAAANAPDVFTGAPLEVDSVPLEEANAPARLTLDPAGYFVVCPDRRHQRLMLEHYSNKGLLTRRFMAISVAAMYITVIKAELITRLDHAAYLGR